MDIATSFWENKTSLLLLAGCVGIIVVIALLSNISMDKDKGDEISKKLGIITVVVFVLCILFGIAAYVYFSSYPAYLTNFVLFMTFANLILNVIAVSASTIRI